MQNHHALSPRTPGSQPYSLLSLPLELSRMMETFMSSAGGLMPFSAPLGLLSQVRIDVLEDESALLLVAEMPGVRAQDIDVELEGQELRISALKNGQTRHDGDRVHLQERSLGRISRTVVLPFHAEAEQVCADFSNGVLSLRVPKPASLKRAQHIQVRDRSRSLDDEVEVPSTHLEPSADGLRPGIAPREGGLDEVSETSEESEGEGADEPSPPGASSN